MASTADERLWAIELTGYGGRRLMRRRGQVATWEDEDAAIYLAGLISRGGMEARVVEYYEPEAEACVGFDTRRRLLRRKHERHMPEK